MFLFNTENSRYPKAWQRQLADIYSARRGHIGFHPGLTSETFSSDQYFVDLQLVKQEKSTTKVNQVELRTYSDLLHLQDDDGRSLNHILVSGQAGMGKTTMVSRIAYQWATEKRKPPKRSRLSVLIGNIIIVLLSFICYHYFLLKLVPLFATLLLLIFLYLDIRKPKTTKTEFLHKFKYVFVLDLRKCETDMSLVGAIESQLFTSISKHQLEEFLTSRASECLYLFDGYDEMSTNDIILTSNLLCGSHVIVTTRPNKIDTFYQRHKQYIQVISKGFSEASIERFVKNYFENSEEISNALLKTIFNNPVVKTFARFPLLLAMICVIWKDRNAFPNTVSELYQQTIEYLARHWKAREPQFESTSYEEFQNSCQA